MHGRAVALEADGGGGAVEDGAQPAGRGQLHHHGGGPVAGRGGVEGEALLHAAGVVDVPLGDRAAAVLQAGPVGDQLGGGGDGQVGAASEAGQ